MDSIPPEKFRDIAQAVAFELGLPWRVNELQEEARAAYETAIDRAERAGMTREQVYDQLIRKHGLYKSVKRRSKGIPPLPSDQSEPTPEQMEAALEAFTVRQWTPVERWPPIGLSPPKEDWPIVEARYGLMESVGRIEVGALLSHIQEDTGELKQRIGTRKVGRIEAQAIMRAADLWLGENRSKLVPVSDAYWAFVFPDMFLEANVKGKGHTAKGQPMAERARPPYIARLLTKTDKQTGRVMKVSAYEVKQMWKRWAKLFADRGAGDAESRAELLLDPDCWMIVHNTAAFKEYLEARRRHEK